MILNDMSRHATRLSEKLLKSRSVKKTRLQIEQAINQWNTKGSEVGVGRIDPSAGHRNSGARNWSISAAAQQWGIDSTSRFRARRGRVASGFNDRILPRAAGRFDSAFNAARPRRGDASNVQRSRNVRRIYMRASVTAAGFCGDRRAPALLCFRSPH